MRSKAEVLPKWGGPRHSTVTPDRSFNASRRAFLQWGAGLVAWATVSGCAGQLVATTPNRPSTSRASREQAVRDIPLGSLQEPLRSQIQQIVFKPTIYRRLPIEVIPCDPELYVFLVRYPEVVVNMWQLMGVTKVIIKRTGAFSYDAQDGAGTVSKVELVYGTRDKHLFMAEGYYEGPLLPRRVTGRCVLLLNSVFSQDAARRSYVSNRLDVFVQLDNVGVEIVAKTLHPLMGRTVDTNFSESTRFVSQVSHVAETNGPGVQRLVTRLSSIEPDVRTQFAQITASINQRAVLRAMGNQEEETAPRVSDRDSDATIRSIIDR